MIWKSFYTVFRSFSTDYGFIPLLFALLTWKHNLETFLSLVTSGFLVGKILRGVFLSYFEILIWRWPL